MIKPKKQNEFDPIFISDNKDDIANIIKNILYLYNIQEYHYRKRITPHVNPDIYYIYKCLCEYIDTEKEFLKIHYINDSILEYKKGSINIRVELYPNIDSEYTLNVTSPIPISYSFSLDYYKKAIREKHLNDLLK